MLKHTLQRAHPSCVYNLESSSYVWTSLRQTCRRSLSCNDVTGTCLSQFVRCCTCMSKQSYRDHSWLEPEQKIDRSVNFGSGAPAPRLLRPRRHRRCAAVVPTTETRATGPRKGWPNTHHEPPGTLPIRPLYHRIRALCLVTLRC